MRKLILETVEAVIHVVFFFLVAMAGTMAAILILSR